LRLNRSQWGSSSDVSVWKKIYGTNLVGGIPTPLINMLGLSLFPIYGKIKAI
jgi:hypothetical protein